MRGMDVLFKLCSVTGYACSLSFSKTSESKGGARKVSEEVARIRSAGSKRRRVRSCSLVTLSSPASKDSYCSSLPLFKLTLAREQRLRAGIVWKRVIREITKDARRQRAHPPAKAHHSPPTRQPLIFPPSSSQCKTPNTPPPPSSLLAI